MKYHFIKLSERDSPIPSSRDSAPKCHFLRVEGDRYEFLIAEETNISRDVIGADPPPTIRGDDDA